MAKKKTPKRTRFVNSHNGSDYFKFVCVGCKAAGMIGVPHEIGMKPIGCPEDCGTTYVRWKPGKTPELKPVVQPVGK